MAALKTITDFDFGAGPHYSGSQRVSMNPSDVSKPERDFILWVMLHQEFYRAKYMYTAPPPARPTVSVDGIVNQRGGGLVPLDEDDGEDDGEGDLYSRIINHKVHQADALKIAKEYAEETLRQAGINLLLEELCEGLRDRMLIQLCRSCDLIPEIPIGSAPEIFQQLRVSKFITAFDVKEPLGKGMSGEVFHVVPSGSHKNSSATATSGFATTEGFAVKRTSVSLSNFDDELKSALNESKFLKLLRGHENIVKLYDYWLEIESSEDDDGNQASSREDDSTQGYMGPLKFYIQLEYCSYSLEVWKEQVLDYDKRPDTSQVLQISRQLLSGIAYVHQKGIMHLDINPRNILWKDTSYKQIKIVDFGLAVVGTVVSYNCGTPPYAAPEEHMTPKSDIYSAAATIVDIARNVRTKAELFEIIKKRDVAVGESTLDKIVLMAIDHEPENRPSAQDFNDRLVPFDSVVSTSIPL